MQGRSWMAALTLAAGFLPAQAVSAGPGAQDTPARMHANRQNPGTNARSGAETKSNSPRTYTVKLELRIAGLGPKGCDIEVKPGHPGCSFEPLADHVKPNSWASFVLKDVQTRSADRDCSFAITIREPGQPERTERRGIRLSTSNARNGVQLLTCYLSAPSRIAKVSGDIATKKTR